MLKWMQVDEREVRCWWNLLAAYPRTLWHHYSNELLFPPPPINNPSLKLWQTVMLQPLHTHAVVSEWRMKEGGKKTLWCFPNYILFSLSLRKKIIRYQQHYIELQIGLCAIYGNPIPLDLPPRYPHFSPTFLFLSLLLCHFPPMGWKC